MMNVMIAYANSAADRWAAWVVAASLDAAVLLALVGLVWLAIRNRVAPQVGYCLFLLVPLKLLVPVVVTVPAAMARWTPSVAGVVMVRRELAVPERIESRPPVETRIAAVGTGQSAPSEPRSSGSQSQPVVADSQPTDVSDGTDRGGRPRPPQMSPAHPVTEAHALSMPADS